MDYEKIMDELKQIESELNKLLSKPYQEGRDKYNDLVESVSMMVRRIYPNYKEIYPRLFRTLYSTMEGEEQEEFLKDVKMLLRGVRTITSEYKLFGFKDFTPLKEKMETETQIGVPKFFSHKIRKSK